MRIASQLLKIPHKSFSFSKNFIEEFQASFEKSQDWKSIYPDSFQEILKEKNPSYLDLTSLREVLSVPFNDIMTRKSKKLRPLLIQIAAELLQINNPQLVLQSSSYIECLHANLLMLDDIMDKSDIRRGAPAIHLKYGIDATLASSGFVHHKTIREFVRNLNISDSAINLRVYELIIEYLELIYVGLGWDVCWHGKKNISRIPSLENYFLMCELKTAKLMNLALEIFQVVCSLDKEKVSAIMQAFNNFGIGFQINDDLINLFSHEYSILKGMDDDLIEGKMSYPILHFCQQNKENFGEIMKLFALLDADNKSRKVLDEIKCFIKTDQCFDDGMQVCSDYMQKCFAQVENTFGSECEGVKKLKQLSEFVIKIDFVFPKIIK